MRLVHRAVFIVSAVAFATASFVPMAPAAPWDDQAKLVLHVRPVTQQSACFAWGALDDCQAAVTTGNLTVPAEGPYYFVYLLVARGSSPANVAEVRTGISYQGGASGGQNDHAGIDVLAWRLCATMDGVTPNVPEWPAPGSGNTIRWDLPESCQDQATAVAGYFYLAAYSADVLMLTGDPADGDAEIRDCASNVEGLDESKELGRAAFGAGVAESACNPCVAPCDGSPVRSATWGGIKGLLR
jgi:hypothetical protein